MIHILDVYFDEVNIEIERAHTNTEMLTVDCVRLLTMFLFVHDAAFLFIERFSIDSHWLRCA